MRVITDGLGRFQPLHRSCSLGCQLRVVGFKPRLLGQRRRLGTRCSCPRLRVSGVAEQAAVDEGAAAERTAPHGAASPPPASGAGVCEVSTLPPQLSLAAALRALSAAVHEVPARAGGACSGLVRLEVPVPRNCKALWWLRGQGEAGQTASLLHPRVYFSPRRSAAPDTGGSLRATAASAGAGSVAGAGAAWLWQGPPGGTLDDAAMSSMQRFLASGPPRMRAFGGARFNAAQAPAPEWEPFGSFYFVLPRVEYTEAAGCGLLACNVAWDADIGAHPEAGGVGFSSLEAAVMDALAALSAVQPPAAPSAGALRLEQGPLRHLPGEEEWRARLDAVHPQLHPASVSAGNYGSGNACATRVSPDAALNEYLLNGQQGLDDLLAALDGGFEAVECGRPGDSLTKVVLARRTDVELAGRVDPLALLEALQERDPRAYQVALQLPTGETFVASTPECLYTRTGDAVASEAVAGTRARGAGGDVEKDFWLSFDLLRSAKDHVEFGVVRDWVRSALGGVCDEVEVEVSKSVLKQGGVQHLYGKLAARLKAGVGDAGLLAALHPTPAVCGQPRGEALELVQAQEPFDRGFYAGPFGWVSHGSAEFVVAIRSALVRPAGSAAAAAAAAKRAESHAAAGPGPGSEVALQRRRRQQRGHTSTSVSLYAGVGIVSGSDTASEWAELDLKVAQYVRLLRPAPGLAEAPNVGALWARLMVEELCRIGCNTFCVAPGSRSSPLTVAIAQHPRARIVPCIDERSLGFWALGHARACGRPAVVVTSSGTAVANLLPSVVEASQSNVPMLLLTADRPAEMRDTGANQTIDQVRIFGSYARWECDMQVPTDEVPARTALTAVGAAVQRAVGTPAGPVHLNCQFREPLAPASAPWDRTCLQGLQPWEDDHLPFTLMAAVPPSTGASSGAAVAGPHLQHDSALHAVLAAVKGARRGLIVAAELIAPEDSMAAVQLAQALGWPLAADALSGLRAGAHAAAGSKVALLSHFDHLLLDRDHWPHLQPDVVLQLGGHLTSKRTAQFLEWCALGGARGGGDSGSGSSGTGSSSKNVSERSSSGGGGGSVPTRWVFVDRSPRRYDQGHLVTHRVQAALPDLVTAVAAATGGGSRTQMVYAQLLAALDGEAAAAVDAAVSGMPELTEPEVARVVTRELPPGEGLFVGNSMPIRDVDMYSRTACTAFGSAPQGTVASGVGAPVGCNRGASGIDGVLSTAAGFADGLGRGCTLLVGDISFLHDINGLNLLRSGEMRPPLTVVLVNNGGGGIFSFLPIAEELPEEVFTPLWATPQHVDLAGMCRAHGIPHLKVSSAEELSTALHSAWGLNRHSVIEAATDRGGNVDRHRQVQAAAQHAVHAALMLLAPAAAAAAAAAAGLAAPARGGDALRPVVSDAGYRRFALPLAKPLTTGTGAAGCREGFYLRVGLQAGGRAASGEGEVSPLPGLHAETLHEAEQQVAALCELLRGVAVPVTAALLGGRFGRWLEQGAGVSPAALHPSVRCGLEAAVLSALAQLAGTSLAALLAAPSGTAAAPAVVVNALIDDDGSAADAAAQASALVASGFGALKIKVGRRADPAADAEAVLAVRRAVGTGVVLRADANRRWTLEQAVQFGTAVSAAQLQYLEEPVAGASQAAEFFRRTGVASALDESIDQGGIDVSSVLPPVISAVVLKPSCLGGFERTLQLAEWAQRQGASAVVSSAFESPLGLRQLAQLAAAIDPSATMQHGLATEGWFAAGAALPQLVEVQPSGQRGAGSMGIAVASAPERGVAEAERSVESTTVVLELRVRASTAAADFDFRLLQVVPRPFRSSISSGNVPAAGANGSRADSSPPVVFLHGFLGSADEWMPHMRALAATGRRCCALDLPGHGATLVNSADAAAYSLQAGADAVAAALQQSGLQGCTLVGYSLGARLALLLAAQRPELAPKVVSVSGTPGIEGGAARAERAAGDAALAEALRRGGLEAFVQRWYQQPLWLSLQAHPRFAELMQRRQRGGDAVQLSRALAAMSPGRAPAAWADLEAAACEGALPRLLLVAGELDAKFVGIAERLAATVSGRKPGAAHAAVVPRCGHAVHLESPLELLRLLTEFV